MTLDCTTGVIDYGGGNIRSLLNALETLGAAPRLVTSPGEMEDLDLVFFPGQGAFGDCMEKLARRGLVEPLRRWVAEDRPFFGICVGYQLLFEGSDESPGVDGLGLFTGRVVRFPSNGLKVPHMGWNGARLHQPGCSPWEGLGAEPYFYFVHSYFPAPADPSLVAAETDYGLSFAAAIQRGRLVATQFHPEKSQRAGLRLIQNFLAAHGVPSRQTHPPVPQ